MSWFDDLTRPITDVGKAIDKSILQPISDAGSQFATFVGETVSKVATNISDIFGVKGFFDDMFKIPDIGFQIQKQFDSAASLPIIYGTTKLAPVVIDKEVSSDYRYLHVFYALCVDGAEIEHIFIDGQNGNDAQWVYDPATDTYNSATRFNGKVTFKVSNGSGGFGTTPTTLGSTHYDSATMQFGKMVAIYARYEYDRNVWQGEPNIYCIVKSTDTTLSNPIKALKHYLVGATSEYGAGLDALEIGASFTTMAAICDQVVTNPDATTRPRFTFNGIVDTKKAIKDNIAAFLQVCDGDLYWDGAYQVKIKGAGDGVFDFNENNTLNNVKTSSSGQSNNFNKSVINFTDKDLGYKTNSAFYDSSNVTYPYGGFASDFRILRDGSQIKEKRITLNGVNNFYECQAFAEKILKSSLFGKAIELSSTWESDIVNIGDIVTVSLTDFGYSLKEFIVAKKTFRLDGTIAFTLTEHDDSIYSVTYTNLNPSQGTATYPNPWAQLPAPTSPLITDVAKGKAVFSFTQVSQQYIVDKYVVKIVNQADSTNIYEFEGNQSPIYFEVDNIGVYDVSIYAVNDLQIKGIETTPITWTSNGFRRVYTQATAPTDNINIDDIWIDNSGAVLTVKTTSDGVTWTNTADETIQAVEADLTIANGGVTINAGGSFKSTGYNLTTNSGIFFGYSGGTYQLMAGNVTNYLRWDGTSLTIKGSITGSTITGGTIRTAASGTRTEINDTSNTVSSYDSGGVKLTELGSASNTVIGSSWGTPVSYTTNLFVSDNSADINIYSKGNDVAIVGLVETDVNTSVSYGGLGTSAIYGSTKGTVGNEILIGGEFVGVGGTTTGTTASIVYGGRFLSYSSNTGDFVYGLSAAGSTGNVVLPPNSVATGAPTWAAEIGTLVVTPDTGAGSNPSSLYFNKTGLSTGWVKIV